MSDHLDIRDLNDSQVSTLLALGLSDGEISSESTIIDLIRQAKDPNSNLVQNLLRDLHTIVNDVDRGPTSLSRLSALAPNVLDSLRELTFLEVLTSFRTTTDVLAGLIKYAEVLAAPNMPASTRLTGFVVGTLAQLGLFTRAGTIEAWNRETASAVLELLGDVKALSPSFVETVRKVLGTASPSSPNISH